MDFNPTMDLTSPSALVCHAVAEMIAAAMPEAFDFVLIVERRDDDGPGSDVAIQSRGFAHSDGVALVEIALELMRSTRPIDVTPES